MNKWFVVNKFRMFIWKITDGASNSKTNVSISLPWHIDIDNALKHSIYVIIRSWFLLRMVGSFRNYYRCKSECWPHAWCPAGQQLNDKPRKKSKMNREEEWKALSKPCLIYSFRKISRSQRKANETKSGKRNEIGNI